MIGPVAAEDGTASALAEALADARVPEPHTSPAAASFLGGARLAESCVSALALPPAHPDLATLAVFRSGYVARLPEGPEVLAEQDDADERIVAAITSAGGPLAAVLWTFVRDRLAEAALLVRACELEAAHLALAETRMTLTAALVEEPLRAAVGCRPAPRFVHPHALRAVPDHTPTKGATR